MFRWMEMENVAPNDVTFLAILSACSHVGLTDLGRWYFKIMVSQYMVKPRVEHYGCMVDLLGRASYLMEAQDLVQDMPFKANAAIWGALTAAARTHTDAELGKQALLHLIELQPHNSGDYNLLSNIYAEQERWDVVSKLRKQIKDRGLRNVPGQVLLLNSMAWFMSSLREMDHILAYTRYVTYYVRSPLHEIY
ncbi:hypothetical protein BRADI_2g09423v3 [Brachypodium distachyon]|uniref:Pentacotripeptide-repeat region of PRORP domain-containing protein n=1 Tax=Brachypodium distachyon TaxID=15368 RepID=A0A0Q3ICU1_BRADI|nr:hypothetical protein BRADI_2g09423v3 [Brachypodium distachyon]